jgi:hypothetical protein
LVIQFLLRLNPEVRAGKNLVLGGLSVLGRVRLVDHERDGQTDACQSQNDNSHAIFHSLIKMLGSAEFGKRPSPLE